MVVSKKMAGIEEKIDRLDRRIARLECGGKKTIIWQARTTNITVEPQDGIILLGQFTGKGDDNIVVEKENIEGLIEAIKTAAY